MFEKYRHIHLVGIGGIGMSGIAEVLLNLGYNVSGSDLKRSAVTRRLKKKGAQIHLGHSKNHLNGAQAVVVSSAVSPNNPEVAKACSLNIPVVPRAEMLAELMRLKYGIAVAGTHGKTTTTSLIGSILTQVGKDPTLIIGGRVNSLRSNARLGKGELLVAEADESDRSFLKLNPTVAVITNIDPEHMENYRNFAELKRCFADFANKVPFYGCAVVCQDHPAVRSIIPSINRRLVTYGLSGSAEYTAKNIRALQDATTFEVWYRGNRLGEAVLHLPGRHHVANALAAVAVSAEFDIPFAKVAKALSSFRGINRRFTILRATDPMVVDDYAHHPVEIGATIDAARSGWPDHNLVVVIQPHRFSRLKNLWEQFVKVLGKADFVIVLPVYPAGEKPLPHITGKQLARKVLAFSPTPSECSYCESLGEVQAALQPWLGQQTMVLFLGAGDITKMAREFVKCCQKN